MAIFPFVRSVIEHDHVVERVIVARPTALRNIVITQGWNVVTFAVRLAINDLVLRVVALIAPTISVGEAAVKAVLAHGLLRTFNPIRVVLAHAIPANTTRFSTSPGVPVRPIQLKFFLPQDEVIRGLPRNFGLFVAKFATLSTITPRVDIRRDPTPVVLPRIDMDSVKVSISKSRLSQGFHHLRVPYLPLLRVRPRVGSHIPHFVSTDDGTGDDFAVLLKVGEPQVVSRPRINLDAGFPSHTGGRTPFVNVLPTVRVVVLNELEFRRLAVSGEGLGVFLDVLGGHLRVELVQILPRPRPRLDIATELVDTLRVGKHRRVFLGNMRVVQGVERVLGDWEFLPSTGKPVRVRFLAGEFVVRRHISGDSFFKCPGRGGIPRLDNQGGTMLKV